MVNESAGRNLIDRLGEPQLDENGKKVLELRYLKRDDGGKVIESPKQLFYRVARNVAEPDRIYDPQVDIDSQIEEFYNLMTQGYFTPNSPTLMNAGRELQQLAACFVLPVEDSMGESGKNTGGITDAWKEASLVHKSGGGTGFSFSRLRPKGSTVRSTHGMASGPISYIGVINEATQAINQGGFRRGANFGGLYVRHPDSYQFLFSKEQPGKLENFNISFLVDEEFMEAVKTKSAFTLLDPQTLYGKGAKRAVTSEDKYVFNKSTIEKWKYDLPNLYVTDKREVLFFPKCEIEKDGDEYKRDAGGELAFKKKFVIGKADEDGTLKLSSEVFMHWFTQINWQQGDPGMVYIDRINEDNPTPHIGKIESTNPCGEQPLLPYEACNLGSINLDKFVEEGQINYGRLEDIVHKSVHFLDNVIDASRYPMEEIASLVHGNRKIGLGVMGLANLLVKLSIPYDSKEAIEKAREIMKFITEKAREASEKIAEKRGKFPNWKGSIYDPESEYAVEEVRGRNMRNATVTTIAPTGSISLINGTEAGIEPLFGVVFKSLRSGTGYYQFNKEFVEIGRREGWLNDENRESLFDKISKNGGSVNGLKEVPEKYQRLFRTAHDIMPEWHVRMQAAFQEHTDNAVSKTVNLPNSANPRDIMDIFLLSHQLRCKGVTIYRDGSKAEQVIQWGEKKEQERTPEPVPPCLPSLRIRQKTPFGHMHVNIVIDPRRKDKYGPGRPLEVFAQLGKGGDVAAADLEAICRLGSLLFRTGVQIDIVAEQLSAISSEFMRPSIEGSVNSLGDAVSKALIRCIIAKQKHPLEDLLLGRVDYNKLDEESSLILKRAGKDVYLIFNGSALKSEESRKDNGRKSSESDIFIVRCDCGGCGGVMKKEGGCWVCTHCGFSKCA